MITAVKPIELEQKQLKETLSDLLSKDGKEYELIQGEFVEIPGPSTIHGRIIVKLSKYLEIYTDTQPVGKVYTGTAFELNPDNAPRPDIAFVTSERLAGIDEFDAFPGYPDLAVEVISRTDKVFEVDDKVKEYLKAGTRLVWVVNPRSKLVFAYQPEQTNPLVLGLADELDGGAVSPGFKLAVKALFEI